jgi:MFS family permease
VRPPTLVILQLLNCTYGFAMFMCVSLANQIWGVAAWSAPAIGLVMTTVWFAYAATARLGGVLAERVGRARTGVLGLGVSLGGFLLSCAMPGPWMAVGTSVAVFFGGALFFPAVAGLVSDAQSGTAAAPMPLHTKISRYNLGWAGGNVAAFALAAALAGVHPRVGYLIAAATLVWSLLVMRRWVQLPRHDQPAAGDRGTHPALSWYLVMCRVAVVVGNMVGMGFIALLECAVTEREPGRHHLVFCLGSASYSVGYVTMFVILGVWGGWIFRPWRTWSMQLGMLAGALGIAWIGASSAPTLLLMPCALVMGLGYASVYVNSLYYSMRLPDGSARAAGIHESCIGLGNTISPILAGIAIELIAHGRLVAPWPGGAAITVGAPQASLLTAQALYCSAMATLCLGWQLVWIPRILARTRAAAAVPAAAPAHG